MLPTMFPQPADELDALEGYYDSLGAMADRAIEGHEAIPVVPAVSELRVVDGWVVWNGRPVWSPVTQALTKAQPVRGGTARDARAAWAAAEHRALDIKQAQLDLDAELADDGGQSPGAIAREQAEYGFYTDILAQLRHAIDHPARLPKVPPADELEFVDGWLLWKGEPVWWSGQGSGPGTAGSSSFASNGSTGHEPRERSRLRRLLTLPWRRAAA